MIHSRTRAPAHDAPIPPVENSERDLMMLAAGWCAAIAETRSTLEPFIQNLDSRHEGTLLGIVREIDETIDHLQNPGGDECQRWAERIRADRRIAGMALSLVQDLGDPNVNMAIACEVERLESFTRLRDVLDEVAAPGQMSAAGVAAQEATVSAALEAGIDEISEADEASIERVADRLGVGNIRDVGRRMTRARISPLMRSRLENIRDAGPAGLRAAHGMTFDALISRKLVSYARDQGSMVFVRWYLTHLGEEALK